LITINRQTYDKRKIIPSFSAYVVAVEKVKITLYKISNLLENEGIPYAVIGGNAVAAWVASVDESAVRATKDTDILLNAQDLDRVTRVLENNGFLREDLKSLTIFVDAQDRNKRTGIHVVLAGQTIRPSYSYPAPDLSEVKRSKEGFFILELFPLVKMKLTSFRDKDRVHLGDMLSVGLITEEIRKGLPDDLLKRLEIVERDHEDEL
jgi:hypothetical protein